MEEGENLALEYDPKCAWALRNPQLFPVEINKAELAALLRVPGIGVRGANKIIQARKYTKLSFEDLIKMRISLKRAKHFITCNGKYLGAKDENRIKGLLIAAENGENAVQTDIFSLLEQPFPVPERKILLSDVSNAKMAISGEL